MRTLQYFQTNLNYFFTHENFKKWASKVAHNRPKPFFSQSSPAHSPELIFHIINMSYLLPYLWCQAIGFYIYADRVSKKLFFLSPKRIFFTTLLNIVKFLSSGSFINWQGHIYIFRIFWQFLHYYSNCNCLPWVIWKQAISFFSVRILHDHQSRIQNLEFSNKKLPFYLFESSDDIATDEIGFRGVIIVD